MANSRTLTDMMIKALPAGFLALFGFAAFEAQTSHREPLQLTYLANEGFLAEVGDITLLFDAFLAQPFAGYPALPENILSRLRTASPPFDSIDLALTSHNHADHFQGRVARDFLLASKRTPLTGTPQVLETLNSTEGWPQDQSERVFSAYPKSGTSNKHSFDDIHIELLRMPHGGMPDVENLGSLVRVKGHTILHLGDAATDLENFAPYEEQLKQADLVLAPVWFFATEKGQAIMKRFFPAKAKVAMHFPKQDTEKVVTSFLGSHKEVLAFSKALQSKKIL